jgi:hypothetical protein
MQYFLFLQAKRCFKNGHFLNEENCYNIGPLLARVETPLFDSGPAYCIVYMFIWLANFQARKQGDQIGRFLTLGSC